MTVDMDKCKRIVQYFWDPEPKNEDPESVIWCLGREYAPPSPDDASAGNDTWPKAFISDFGSRVWITYRSNFIPIPRTKTPEATSSMTLGVRLRSQLMDSQGFTSDTGWGCMIRSGQALLANTLSILVLGRGENRPAMLQTQANDPTPDWRRGEKVEEESKLLSLFADHPDAPFSIHRFVDRGANSCGKYPGEWFGPSATAKCIELLSTQDEPPHLRVYVTNDSDVYEDKFTQVACDRSGKIQPTLILIGTRLGIDQVTTVYWHGLQSALKLPQSVGVAGGRPSASHYFLGVQGSHFFFLDPHTTRPTTAHHPQRLYTSEELDSYYTTRLRRIHIKDMDPSMLIGFLIRDETDWIDWKHRIQTSPGKPIVHIFPGKQATHGEPRAAALDEVEALDDSDEE
ncbi:unnamed protein product [Penicillium olsonii]|nr:unnamed protein product [Penicillium olsonii]